MKAEELRKKTLEDLKKIEKELRKKLNELFIEKKLKKLTKPNLFKKTRKDLARVLTIMKEKQNEKAVSR